jgi:hypothetical protein
VVWASVMVVVAVALVFIYVSIHVKHSASGSQYPHHDDHSISSSAMSSWPSLYDRRSVV